MYICKTLSCLQAFKLRLRKGDEKLEHSWDASSPSSRAMIPAKAAQPSGREPVCLRGGIRDWLALKVRHLSSLAGAYSSKCIYI